MTPSVNMCFDQRARYGPQKKGFTVRSRTSRTHIRPCCIGIKCVCCTNRRNAETISYNAYQRYMLSNGSPCAAEYFRAEHRNSSQNCTSKVMFTGIRRLHPGNPGSKLKKLTSKVSTTAFFIRLNFHELLSAGFVYAL